VTDAVPPSALERCVGDPGRFLAESWGRAPMIVPNPGGRGFADLLGFEDVDRLLATTGLRAPSFRLVKDGNVLPVDFYTRSGRTGSVAVSGMLDPALALRQFENGATIVFQSLHRTWLPLATFCRELDLALGHPTQVNAYITPPGARGLAVHEDSHDVFVLQAFGSKRWQVWPTRPGSKGGKVDPAGLGEPLHNVTMQPGDSMYLPMGTPHAASAQETVSGHLTIGILTVSWRSVAHDLFGRAEGRAELDERLPAGFHRDPEGFREAVANLVADLAKRVADVDPNEVADAAVRRFLTGRPPVLPGGFADVLDASALTSDTLVRRRAGSACVVALHGDRLSVYLGDRELRTPAWLEPVIRDVAERTELRARDLVPLLDLESSVVLVRRLVREGLLEIDR
jgi:bifunctional lysine-specific demethylase and histidyl-hydroxylase NO66